MKVKCSFKSHFALQCLFSFFLEQEGCYRQFVRNVGGTRKFILYCHHLYQLSGRGDSCLSAAVLGAFEFSSTLEGVDFWTRIHVCWNDFLTLE